MANKALHDDRGRGNMRTGTSNNQKSVCLDVGRVFDSCSDRDCIEDLRVYFSPCDQQRVDAATAVRAKGAKVIATCIDVEELPFREGCYACKLIFYVEIKLELYTGCDCGCDTVCGCVSFEKKVVLYGGEGNVQVFSSELNADCRDRCEMASANMPRCTVQAAQPVVLDVSIVEACGCSCGVTHMPETVCSRFGGQFMYEGTSKVITVTIGIFTIVQMVRNVQMLVPYYDYCLPCKECSCDEDTPCDLFKKMSFPIEEFYPPVCK